MAVEQVAASMERVVSALRRKPHAGLHEDTPATVRWAGGLRTVSRTAAGAEVVTDMPVAIGGDDSAPTPGWLLRTALASCAVNRCDERHADGSRSAAHRQRSRSPFGDNPVPTLG